MLRKWFGVAVLAVCGLQPRTTTAQEIPTPFGAARIPEPLPLRPTLGPDGQPVRPPAGPDLVQGPISPEAAPAGPPDELSYSAGHTSAFQAENVATHNHVFLHLGSLFLQRQRLGHQVYVYTDLTPRSGPIQEQNQLPENLTFVQPVLQPNDIIPSGNFGVTATFGYLGQSGSIELSGFYIPENSDEQHAMGPRALNAFFGAPPQLAALGGTLSAGPPPVLNDLYLQGDIATVTLTTALGSADINYRYFPKNVTSIEPLLGIRYVNFSERFTFRFDDDGLTSLNPIGATNGATSTLISSKVVNSFIGAEFGMENQLKVMQGVAVGLSYKGAVGVDHAKVDYTLANAGYTFARIYQRTRRNLASVQEVSTYLDAYYLERLRLRAGYRVMWLMNFIEPVDQFDFDLSHQQGRTDNTGHIFFHGASLELQILF